MLTLRSKLQTMLSSKVFLVIACSLFTIGKVSSQANGEGTSSSDITLTDNHHHMPGEILAESLPEVSLKNVTLVKTLLEQKINDTCSKVNLHLCKSHLKRCIYLTEIEQQIAMQYYPMQTCIHNEFTKIVQKLFCVNTTVHLRQCQQYVHECINETELKTCIEAKQVKVDDPGTTGTPVTKDWY